MPKIVKVVPVLRNSEPTQRLTSGYLILIVIM